jgi:ADP-ribose pyrophosphatase
VELYLGLTHAPETSSIHGVDEHQDIRVLMAPPEEAYAWTDHGRIVNGPALVGLQWFRSRENHLRTGVRRFSAD